MHAPLISTRPAFLSFSRMLLLIIVAFGIIGQVLSLIALSLMVDGDLQLVMAYPEQHPELRNALLIAQAIGGLAGLILIPAWYMRRYEEKNLGIFFHQTRPWWLFLLVLASTGLVVTAMSPLVEWNAGITLPEWLGPLGKMAQEMEKNAERVIAMMTDNMQWSDLLLSVLVVGVLTAFGEEIAFRGLLQTELVRAVKHPHMGIWLSAALFSAFHFQFFGFVPRLILGAYLGYLYYWSGSLWLSVAAHFINNAAQLVALYLYQQGLLGFDPNGEEAASWPVVIVSAVAGAILLYFIWRNFRRPSTGNESTPQPQ